MRRYVVDVKLKLGATVRCSQRDSDFQCSGHVVLSTPEQLRAFERGESLRCPKRHRRARVLIHT